MIYRVCEHELAGVYSGPGVRLPSSLPGDRPLRPFWEEPDFRPPPELTQFESAYGRPGIPIIPPIGNVPVSDVLSRANETLISQLGRSGDFNYIFNLTAYGKHYFYYWNLWSK